MQSPADRHPVSPANCDDEIDLLDLIEGLWKQKLLIMLVTLLFTVVGGCYAFFTTPTYLATSQLIPPSTKDIDELEKLKNIDSSGSNYTTETVFSSFLLTLQSNDARKAFFEQPEVKQYFLTKAGKDSILAWHLFNEAISINTGKDNKTASVSLATDSPQKAAEWTNEFVSLAAELSSNKLAADLKEEIQTHIDNLKQEIKNSRVSYQSQIDTELSKLNEALGIARALNLTEPLRTDSVIEGRSDMMVDEIRRLYRLGSKALEAEIAAIGERRKNEVFIPELSRLERNLNLLEKLAVDGQNIKPAIVDLQAQPNDKPIKPKKLFILALSVVLGGMAGIVTALLRMAIINRREKSAD
ncbi:LPS O-antigen chain length determinant protein WzzB [Marinobacterium lutimaris]|uniref:Chain length determinant protein (Polysaccharide antigen chain regulator) n=1 Tax=Marinobacterium lutimaris TaxID=568106 RepID=A0A1H6BA64_9GAMM|nr:Wzz/FepE/Etk N-terminal domain-containing protein [Marinobacterium lutimaris]SEG57056.1 chain length determinant protein (polysaccharide antigen chain regulator) [Marinobacterium lutimaris]